MKKEDKVIIKNIMQNKDLEQSLSAYSSNYINTVYEYGLIRLVLNYYTMKEIEDESAGISSDESLSDIMEQVHSIMFRTILADEMDADYNAIVVKLDELRSVLTDKMTVLTAYTDALQLYEYILNRLEYSVTKEEYPVDEVSLATKVFRYLFKDNDKMVVNSKIQMVTGQLPIRMTKNRFFDYLSDTLNIYVGSEQSSVDGFISMIKSTALLELPERYGKDYEEIAKVIRMMETLDYKNLDLELYQGIMEQFAITTQRLTELVSNHLLAMEIVNNLYATVLALPYETNKEEGTIACKKMLKGLHDAFVAGGEIPEIVDEGFMQIEGIQEMLGEDAMQYEAVLMDVIVAQGQLIEGLMLDKIFKALSFISKLLSNSMFIELEEEEQASEIADSLYVNEKRDQLVALLSEFFTNHPKEVNRAVMASMFSSMPVLFNSQQEVKEYIEYSLSHCSNASELMACAKILEDMMLEE